MPVLEPHHDLAHPVGPDAAWSESYYFNGYDENSSSGLFTRIGIRPNEGTMDVGLSVWLPDGQLAEYRHVLDQHEMIDTVLAVGGVRYEMLEPMRRWRLVADVVAPARACATGSSAQREVRLEMDLEFEALTDAIGTDGTPAGTTGSAEAAAAAGTTGKGHYEQAGRWRGWLAVDGARVEWTDARGNRDGSWGPRRWGGPTMWRWFSINIGDDLHFGGIRLGTGSGDLHRGWVWREGRATSVATWALRTELAPDALTQRVVHLEVTDKRGRTYRLRGDVLRVADIGRPGGTVINEGLTAWTCTDPDGGVGHGFGIAEYLHQLDEAGRPVVPVE
jgi:hypothetical protein